MTNSPLEQRLVHIGDRPLVTGREEHQVDRLLAAVGEDHGVGPQFGDVGLGEDVAVGEVVQDLGVQDRVRGKRGMVGSRGP